jgi:hypothetical protein
LSNSLTARMRRWQKRFWHVDRSALFALLLVALGASTARGDPVAASASPARVRIVLVTNHSDAAIVPLLRAEFEALGMHVELEDRGPKEMAPRDLNTVARRHQAVAAVRVLLAAGVVEVWIADRVTGKVVLRDVIAQGGGNVDETLVALRAVELLRGSLMELNAPHDPRGEVPPSPAVRALAGAVDNRERYTLGVAGAGMWSEGGSTAVPAFSLALTWRAWRWFACRGWGATALVPATLSAEEGSAAFTLRWVEIDAMAVTPPSIGRWRGSVGVGLGLHAVSMEGRATEPYWGSDKTLWSLAPTVSASAGYVVTGPVRVVLSAWGASMLRFSRAQFAGRDVGRYGALIVGAGLGMEVTWP